MSDIIRPLLVMGSPVLAALAGSILYSRSHSKALRLIGLSLSILVFTALTILFITSSIAHLQQGGIGFGDIIIALAAIVYAAAAPILLLPLSAKKLPIRLAWLIPAGFGLLIALLTHILTQRGQTITDQMFTGFLLLIGITVISIGLTWLCCLYRKPA